MTPGRLALYRLLIGVVMGGTAAGLWTPPGGALAIVARVVVTAAAGLGILYLGWLHAAEYVAIQGRIVVEEDERP